MSDNRLPHEPIFWTMVTGFFLSLAVVVAGNVFAFHAERLAVGFVFRNVVPIYVPILSAMLAYFFHVGDPHGQRVAAGPQNRIAYFLTGCYSLIPPVLLLFVQKEELEAVLTGFYGVGQPLLAYLLVYYFHSRARGA